VLIPDDTLGPAYSQESPDLFPNRLMLLGLHTVRGYDVLVLSDYSNYIYKMQNLVGEETENAMLEIYNPADMNREHLSCLNVRYFAHRGKLVAPDFEQVFQGDPNIYIYTDYFPRAYVLPENLVIPKKLHKDSQAQIMIDTPNELIVEVDLKEPGWLVVTDNFYPGWKAEADGKPLQIEKILGTFRGIFLEPGSYKIRMYYYPIAFKQGLVISLGGVLLLIGINVWAIKYRRH